MPCALAALGQIWPAPVRRARPRKQLTRWRGLRLFRKLVRTALLSGSKAHPMVVDREIMIKGSLTGRRKESGKPSTRLQSPDHNPRVDRAGSTPRSTGGYSSVAWIPNLCSNRAATRVNLLNC